MSNEHPLALTPDQMRALGSRALDIAVDHYEHLRDRAACGPPMDRAYAASLVDASLAETPKDPHELLAYVQREIFPPGFHSDHPRFYSFVPSPGNFVSVVGDFLTSAANLFAGHWMASPTAAQIESTVIDWMRGWCGLPESAGGIFVSGGSLANLSAIATAREVKLGGPNLAARIYCSDQTHSSLFKGLRILGFTSEQRRVVPTDKELRLSVVALEQMLAEDRAKGLVPFCIVANAGTTNTGAVDPLEELAAICRREQLWLHVDGAYGAPAILTERGRAALAGLEHADSITVDPHKWLFQPYELGCLLVRNAGTLRKTFRIDDDDHADYLADVTRHIKGNINFFDMGPQLTRSFKALKLWLSLQTFGLSAFRRAIDAGIDLAEHAERVLRADERWEIVTPARLGVVTFRWRGDAAAIDRLTAATVDAMGRDGYALVMSTFLHKRPALRLCTIHPGGRPEEIEETIARLTAYSNSLSGDAAL